MDIQNEYLPADKQDIDNITTLYEEEEKQYEPEVTEDEDREKFENIMFVVVGAVIMILSVLAYLNFTN